jgi:hypothetical protein
VLGQTGCLRLETGDVRTPTERNAPHKLTLAMSYTVNVRLHMKCYKKSVGLQNRERVHDLGYMRSLQVVDPIVTPRVSGLRFNPK